MAHDPNPMLYQRTLILKTESLVLTAVWLTESSR